MAQSRFSEAGRVLILLLPVVLAAGAADAATLFQDTYTRDDAAPPEDSLGTTEAGGAWSALDYTEIDADGGLVQVADIARVERGRLVVVGGPGTTDPAFARLQGAGRDLTLGLEAEFLAAGIDAPLMANSLAVFFRNGGVADDGTLFSPGTVLFDLEIDGWYLVRAIVGGPSSFVLYAQGRIDPDAFAAADLDGDMRLEAGEPFSLRFALDGPYFSFAFEGRDQVVDLYMIDVPLDDAGMQHVLLGRNRISSARPFGTAVAFDDLRTESAVDADGDGWPVTEDCDDADAEVHPGAEERCNGLDDDCDGTVPETELDLDGDGYARCEDDCDDGDPDVHPGAEEACNGLDDDCDGIVPDTEFDLDGDGYTGCGGDCEPEDPSAFPGAPDYPGNTVDEDCDGEMTCDPRADWRNHGQWMRCVVHALKDLRTPRSSSPDAFGPAVSRAARSPVGRRASKR